MVQEAESVGLDAPVYLNGSYVTSGEASVPLDERGFLFGEGVYEVTRFYNGSPFLMQEHLDRLLNSLEGIGLSDEATRTAASGLVEASYELLRRQDLQEAIVYWQVSRGVSRPRSFVYKPNTPVQVFAMAYGVGSIDLEGDPPTTTALLTADERWENCWIKSTMLMPNNMAYNRALDAGFGAAILHRGDVVTEASSSNVMLVQDGVLITHPANGRILNGITRQALLRLAGELGLEVREEPYPVAELDRADEVFITGTTTHVTPVLRIGDKSVGSGEVGPVARKLHGALMQAISEHCYSKDVAEVTG